MIPENIGQARLVPPITLKTRSPLLKSVVTNSPPVKGSANIAMSGTNLYIGYSTFGVGHGCSIGSITRPSP